MFEDLKVLVIGDVCLDVIEEGQSFRQSPEAPVPVILNPKESYSLGMAANVALNLHTLGADVGFMFVYGADKYGDIFYELTQEKFGQVNQIQDDKSKYTMTVKKRIVANGSQVARIDFEKDMTIDNLKHLIDKLKEHTDLHLKYDLVIISDYNKGIITKESWPTIKSLIEQLSDNFFVDTKKKDVLSYYEGMYIFPNKKEMEEIMEYNMCKTRRELREEMDLDFLVETASEEGAFIYTPGKIFHCKAFKSKVVDVTGCGDTFIAAFSLHYTKYKKKRMALEFANYCCSKVIEKAGTHPIYIEEVLDFERKRN